jgi:hypothetical protein
LRNGLAFHEDMAGFMSSVPYGSRERADVSKTLWMVSSGDDNEMMVGADGKMDDAHDSVRTISKQLELT